MNETVSSPAPGLENAPAAGGIPESELYENLALVNGQLQSELDRLKKELERRDDRDRMIACLRELAGGESDPLFARALRIAEEEGGFASLSPEKRGRLSYLLCLGEDSLRSGGRRTAPPPAFARSGGGEAPASPMKLPGDFETARENARKYFGGR